MLQSQVREGVFVGGVMIAVGEVSVILFCEYRLSTIVYRNVTEHHIQH